MTDTPSSYDIEILGFPGAERPRAIEKLARVFRIDAQRAERLIDRAPIVVKTSAPRPEAERYTRALLGIGADVRVIGIGGTRVFRASESGSGGGGPLLDAASGEPASGGATPRPQTPGGGAAVLRRTRSREIPAAARIQCPRCGFEQPESDACQRCGIVFAKYSDGNGHAESTGSAAPPRSSRLTPSSLRADVATGRPRAVSRSRYLVSGEDDDDGLFLSARPTVDPGRIMAEAAAITGILAPVGRSPGSGSYAPEHAVIREPTGEAAERSRGSADVGFWDKLGRAALYGVRGASWQWLALMGTLGAISFGVLKIMALAPVLTMQIFGLFVLVVLFSAFLAAQWRFFTAAFHSAVVDRDDDPPPIFGLEDFKSEFVLPGELLCVAALILWSPFLYVVISALESGRIPSPQLVVLLTLLPMIYWPMGMAQVSASGRLTDIFVITGVVKGIAIGGLEYAFVAALAVLVFLGLDRLVAAVGEVTVYAWALLYAALGYTSAVQGYLLGRLLRRRPHMIAGTIVEEGR